MAYFFKKKKQLIRTITARPQTCRYPRRQASLPWKDPCQKGVLPLRNVFAWYGLKLRYSGQDTLLAAQNTNITTANYHDLLNFARRTSRAEGIDKALVDNKADIIIGPPGDSPLSILTCAAGEQPFLIVKRNNYLHVPKLIRLLCYQSQQ